METFNHRRAGEIWLAEVHAAMPRATVLQLYLLLCPVFNLAHLILTLVTPPVVWLFQWCSCLFLLLISNPSPILQLGEIVWIGLGSLSGVYRHVLHLPTKSVTQPCFPWIVILNFSKFSPRTHFPIILKYLHLKLFRNLRESRSKFLWSITILYFLTFWIGWISFCLYELWIIFCRSESGKTVWRSHEDTNTGHTWEWLLRYLWRPSDTSSVVVHKPRIHEVLSTKK